MDLPLSFQDVSVFSQIFLVSMLDRESALVGLIQGLLLGDSDAKACKSLTAVYGGTDREMGLLMLDSVLLSFLREGGVRDAGMCLNITLRE